jgi:hypothetical protein
MWDARRGSAMRQIIFQKLWIFHIYLRKDSHILMLYTTHFWQNWGVVYYCRTHFEPPGCF